MVERAVDENQEQPQEQEQQRSALEMSDEDIMNLSPEEFAARASGQQNSEDELEETDEESSEETQEPETDDDNEPEEEEAPVSKASRSPYGSGEGESETSETLAESASESEESESESEESQDGIDYKAEYEDLLKPFKASGREVSVSSVADARRLMQMGVDYQNKMRALKPHLRIMKALERNDLLNEEKVNHFIDLDKKNPEAIAKFLKEKGIDPVEIDLDQSESYRTKSYAPSDKEMELQEAIDSIRGSSAFDRTMDELGNKWDTQSQTVLHDNPHLVIKINEHMEAGIYDQIMNVVESERMLGRLQGLHDLAAYKEVGDALQKQGAFKPKATQRQATAPKSQPAPKVDPKKAERKRAASITRGSGRKNMPKQEHNPLSMSDAEFEKVLANGLPMH